MRACCSRTGVPDLVKCSGRYKGREGRGSVSVCVCEREGGKQLSICFSYQYIHAVWSHPPVNIHVVLSYSCRVSSGGQNSTFTEDTEVRGECDITTALLSLPSANRVHGSRSELTDNSVLCLIRFPMASDCSICFGGGGFISSMQ